ncbi:phosphotransferase family protein [Pseudonocardia sp. Cha107L01]|uniref:phosphotransferase family protein n=1 Tax=Pseudonocardia sp. Cha107L01 TaxID=3457576 RepID=UPI00403E7962
MSLTEETAHRLLAVAGEQLDLDVQGATLIRIGSNAVFRLEKPVIVRIARDPGPLDEARKQVAVARWLEDAGYSATRALHDEQPIDIEGHAVTAWQSVSEREEYAPVAQVAALIRQLHALTPPASLKLPSFEPFMHLGDRLGNLDGIDENDAKFLRERAIELAKQYERLSFPLGYGPIHGDANVGNVILSDDGDPVLIDLDSFAKGPREWDLVQTALFYDRFGWHTRQEYRTFVEVYGFDIMTWAGYATLADYRELSMTLWLAGKAREDDSAAREISKRVSAIQTGGSRREWAPF